jgi:CHRD domain
MQKLIYFSFLFFIVMVIACKKTDSSVITAPPTPDLMVSTVLLGQNEVPFTVPTTATGSVKGTYNKTTKILSITIIYADLIPNGWHIHLGAEGTVGSGIIFVMKSDLASPFAYKTTLSENQEQDLLSGLYYVNVHTKKAPDGEIRGNLNVK